MSPGRKPFGPPDEVLVRRSLKGDLRAFTELVDRYKDPVYNLAYRMLRHREDAEDLAQEVFLHVFRALDKFDLEQRFSPWIYRIASNLCLDKLRKNRTVTVSLDTPLVEDRGLYRQIPDPAAGPQEITEVSETRREIQSAIDALPEKYRMIVILRHTRDLAYEEIAEALSLPLGTVKTRLFRARESLRRHLEGQRELGEPEPGEE
ncbi:MAG: sigma-70 family RNA polymerase sigma factor [Bacillota bacterium]